MNRNSALLPALTIELGLMLTAAVSAAGDRDHRLTLPPAIYAVPGSEMNVFFANTVLVAPGREKEIRFQAECAVGTIDAQKWTLNAADSEVGEHRFVLRVLDPEGGKVLEEAQSVVRVVPRNAGVRKDVSLLIIGDSLTGATQYPNDLARRLNEPGNPAWRMLGANRPASAKPGVNHEGYGGWTWKRFRTQFNPDAPQPGKRASSPFVFDGRLDVARYFAERCGGKRPDFITVLLGINDCFHPNPDDPEAIEQRIDAMFAEAEPLLEAIRQAAPSAEIGIGLTTPGNARDEAFAANYGDRYTRWGWRRIQHRVVEREIEHFGGREEDGIFLVPTQLNLDCVHGYPENNGVHPNGVGYAQIAAALHAWLKWRLASAAR